MVSPCLSVNRPYRPPQAPPSSSERFVDQADPDTFQWARGERGGDLKTGVRMGLETKN